MNPERHQQLKELFHAAVALPTEARAAYLDASCGHDAAIRAEIEALLIAHDTPTTPVLKDSPSAFDGVNVALHHRSARKDDFSLEGLQADIGARYRLAAVAGSGGMGKVFMAEDLLLKRRVAVKMLHRPSGSQAAMVSTPARLLDEARSMANLNHPNICRILEVAIDGELPFIVMEWVEGIDLRSACRGMELKLRVRMFHKIVQGAAAAHSAGLMHRDLKPGNILVDRWGEPVIVDFGLARFADTEREGYKGTKGGTPGYAAPEQFDGQEVIGKAADVYALGVILFELLTDRLPFQAASIEELNRLTRDRDPPIPETFTPNLPWPLQRICLAALERKPSDRYPDAEAMLLDLERYLRGEAVAARPTMLARNFEEQVEQQMLASESWQRQGLISEPEGNRLRRLLYLFLRPESHWIMESRRLSISQVTLYLGGWLVLVALTVGLILSWHAMEELSLGWLRGSIGAVITAIMLTAGVQLHLRKDSRVSLGFLMTGCLAVPIGLWLLMRETGWLTAWSMVDAEWSAVYLLMVSVDDALNFALLNWQLFVLVLAFFVAATGLRLFIRSSAFTPFIMLAAVGTWVVAWACAGMLGDDAGAHALLGLWFAAFGFLSVPIGIRLNRQEEECERAYGRARTRTRDSWSVALGGLLALVLGLAILAWKLPEWWLGSGHDRLIFARAGFFLVNGLVLQVYAHIFERSKTLVRARMAELIRWITPQHFLGAILAMEIDALFQNRSITEAWGWLIALFVAAIGITYLSILKQWRPFLVTGLLYIAIAYGCTFVLGDREGWTDATIVGLALAGLIGGLLTMLVAWKATRWTTLTGVRA